MVKELNYTYLRTEKDAKYNLFLKINHKIVEQEIDISMNENGQLVLDVKDGDIFISKKLTDEIFNVLNTEKVFTLFVDENANILATYNLELYKTNQVQKPKGMKL